ncbi:putative membrane protein [Plasmodium gaboni]|uniref:Putative membrane protein n=1 Tax=Plasmodium gaboni TaxID=647221 RepID=A0A151LLJ7_9APIC|nr:putative membrane protein [Plasmodium gaboni]KYO00081.1 putative membrane protein [Plasmodium gaboni]
MHIKKMKKKYDPYTHKEDINNNMTNTYINKEEDRYSNMNKENLLNELYNMKRSYFDYNHFSNYIHFYEIYSNIKCIAQYERKRKKGELFFMYYVSRRRYIFFLIYLLFLLINIFLLFRLQSLIRCPFLNNNIYLYEINFHVFFTFFILIYCILNIYLFYFTYNILLHHINIMCIIILQYLYNTYIKEKNKEIYKNTEILIEGCKRIFNNLDKNFDNIILLYADQIFNKFTNIFKYINKENYPINNIYDLHNEDSSIYIKSNDASSDIILLNDAYNESNEDDHIRTNKKGIHNNMIHMKDNYYNNNMIHMKDNYYNNNMIHMKDNYYNNNMIHMKDNYYNNNMIHMTDNYYHHNISTNKNNNINTCCDYPYYNNEEVKHKNKKKQNKTKKNIKNNNMCPRIISINNDDFYKNLNYMSDDITYNIKNNNKDENRNVISSYIPLISSRRKSIYNIFGNTIYSNIYDISMHMKYKYNYIHSLMLKKCQDKINYIKFVFYFFPYIINLFINLIINFYILFSVFYYNNTIPLASSYELTKIHFFNLFNYKGVYYIVFIFFINFLFFLYCLFLYKINTIYFFLRQIYKQCKYESIYYCDHIMNEIYENFIFLEIINNVFDDEQQTQDQEKKDMEERNFSDYIKKNKTESNMDSYDIQDNNIPRFQKYNMNKKNEENKNKHYHHIITNTQYIDNNDSKDNSNIISQSINSHTNTHIHNKVHKWVQCDDVKPTNETDVYIDSNKDMNKYINIDHLNDHKKNYQ